MRRLVLRWGLGLLLVLVLLTILQVSFVRFFNPPFTVAPACRWFFAGHGVRSHELLNSWMPLKKISPHLRRAVLAGEDQRFLSHHGFDFTEMDEAIRDIILQKGYRGASTITMQMARTVFLWPGGSWGRKMAEAYYTLLVDLICPKERIFEIYLNTVDWGTGITGVEAASMHYYHISSARLSKSQAAYLAAVLPSPHRWSPTNPSTRLQRRQQRILKDMDRMPLRSPEPQRH